MPPTLIEPTSAPTDDVSLLRLLSILLFNVRLIAACVIVMALAGAGVSFTFGREFTATSRLLPTTPPSAVSRLGGIAAQLGLATAVGSGETLDYFAELARSRGVLNDVASSTGLVDTTLPVAEALQRARRTLARRVDVSADARSGIVTVRTRARTPELAERINAELVGALNRSLLRQRQSRAETEHSFVESRLGPAREELEKAESEVSLFLRQNRLYQGSPELVQTLNSLQRRVDLKQGVFLTLSQSSESASLDAMRNVPVITEVDSPIGSAEPPRSPIIAASLGSMLGAALGLVIVVLRELFRAERLAYPDDYGTFATARRALLPQIRG